MKSFVCVSAVLALTFSIAGATVRQEMGKQEPTGAEKVWDAVHKQCCSKEGKCEGDQKKMCDQVGSTVKAALARTVEKCQKEGLKCEECAKSKDGGPCRMCQDMMVKVLVPWVKKQAVAKDAMHKLPTAGGKSETIPCSLVKGPICKGCVEEMSDAVVKACKEAVEKKK
ncbi:MAG: hypothetical protein HY716_16275 [Planctomycetes bacterium]|nr:hypothetical protein [Planctomycetota bacterium]